MGKSRDMRCWRKVNVGRINERLNGKPLAEVDYIKYMKAQVLVDGRCERK